ncbi:MAG: DNA repair protein RadC [Flavobacteriales bacterium]|jgi:DNA repair protein RadC|nr:MAG: DNA repair protein RadC [Flavobacteriales bacterium]
MEEQEDARMPIRAWARDDRPREKLMAHGARALSDAELLAILIRSGSTKESAVDLAKRIMAHNGNDLHRLARLGVDDLVRYSGMGEAKAIAIVAALELGRRRRATDPPERPSVTSSAVAYELIRASLADLPSEEFWLLLMDRGNRLLERMRISAGGMHGTVADPKVIFKAAIDKRASGLVLCHNHPSGQLRPSEEDIRLTRKLTEGARLLDIAVQDHLIVTATGYFSFADNGMMG